MNIYKKLIIKMGIEEKKDLHFPDSNGYINKTQGKREKKLNWTNGLLYKNACIRERYYCDLSFFHHLLQLRIISDNESVRMLFFIIFGSIWTISLKQEQTTKLTSTTILKTAGGRRGYSMTVSGKYCSVQSPA